MATRLDVATCERIVDRVASHCAVPPQAPSTAQTDSSASQVANAFALAGDAIMLATFGLALLVAIGTVGWFYFVAQRTRDEIKRVAPGQIRAYLDEIVPGLVAENLASLTVNPISPQSGEGLSAEDQAEDLGGEPR